jgi:hypothetical protein
LESTAAVQNILKILNSFHPSIKFTHEDEKEQKEIIREKFQTTVFRKSSFTGLMLKWNSFVPKQYKTGSIISMVQRAINVCSTYQLLSDEFEQIRQLGLKNGYPISFLHTQIGI